MFALARKKLKPSAKMIVLEPVLFDGQSPLRKWVMTKDRGNNIKPDNESKTLLQTHSRMGDKQHPYYAKSNSFLRPNRTRRDKK
jgi:hypothetical protein